MTDQDNNLIFIGVLIGTIVTFLIGCLVFIPSNNELQQQVRTTTYMKDCGIIWTDTFKTTMYTTDPSECSKQKSHPFFGVTFSGHKAVPNRTVAVDPNIIPIGSVIIDIETNQIYIADDTGNKVKGKHIDLFVGPSTSANKKKMDAWGCKNRQYIIIENKFKGEQK